jgi:DNA repair protein RecO (recombination protein O)
MLEKSQGIVLRTIPYSESSLVARIFTRRAGLQGFIVSGMGKGRSRGKAGLFQPLTLVDLVYYDNHRKGLHRIREIACPLPYGSIPYRVHKSAIALFIAELLSLSTREGEADENLFEFLVHSLHILDLTDSSCELFHLFFVVRLSKYLGFYPDDATYRPGARFNLSRGTYTPDVRPHELCLDEPLTRALYALQHGSYETLDTLDVPRADRMRLLEALVTYYEMQLPQGVRMKSHRVLHETLG